MNQIRNGNRQFEQQAQMACIIASMLVRRGCIEQEQLELDAIEQRREFYKSVLAVAMLVLSFTVIVWPVVVR